MTAKQPGQSPTTRTRVQRGWQRVGRWLALAGRGAATTPFFAHHGSDGTPKG
ncbi:MAG: hypothetical protein ACK46X_13800 [Candidatus Sericytochromatia bacterium]